MDINPDCAALGWMYHDQSSGVEKDPAQAVAWYRKAAEQGYAPGQTNLGWMYEQGSGIKKDLKQAIDWYRKAAAGGEEYAKQNLTRLGVLVE